MSQEKNVSRRTAIAAIGGLVVGGVIGGSAGYLMKPSQVMGTTQTVTQTMTETLTQAVTQTQTAGAGVPSFGTVNGKQLSYIFISHGGEDNLFWNAVNKGMLDGASLLGVNATMVRPTTEGDQGQILANFQAAIAKNPDGIICTVDYASELPLISQATKAGIPVIVSNIDSPNAQDRINAGGLAYVGQSLAEAGGYMAQQLTKQYPSSMGSVILVEGPGQTWAEQRFTGISGYLKANGYAYTRLDTSSFEPSVVDPMLSAYFEKNPNTGALYSVGYAAAEIEPVSKQLNLAPGKVKVAGFDLVPSALSAVTDGYETFILDQQPYLQGFVPVWELVMIKKFLFSAFDANTGDKIVDSSNIAAVADLSKAGYWY
jgi:simple sugar transport system substrate-binding protein